MLGLLYIFLVMVLQLDVIFYQVFDLFMFFSKCALQVVNFVLLLLEIVAYAGVFFLVALQLFFKDIVIISHFVDKCFDLNNLPVYF
jgi:hypothetical protein